MKKHIPFLVGFFLFYYFPSVYAENMPIQSGLYLGGGGSWNTIDETFQATLATSSNQSSQDQYEASANRIAPLLQLGYWSPYCEWLWGVQFQWKYLGYRTANENADHGQHIPNATFSSINFFGPNVVRDFASQTHINNEFLLLAYVGEQFKHGFAYLGLGPAWLTASHSIYVNSIHRPNGVGNHLITTSVNAHHILWSGAVQIGYSYYVDPTWFVNVNYTFVQSGQFNFNNNANASILNGFNNSGLVTLHVNRHISVRTQEIMLTINKVFDLF